MEGLYSFADRRLAVTISKMCLSVVALFTKSLTVWERESTIVLFGLCSSKELFIDEMRFLSMQTL